MEHCSILDLREIADAVELTVGEDVFDYVRQTLLHPEHYWFRSGNLFAHAEMIGRHKYTIHSFGTSSGSLKENIKFFQSVGAWVIDNVCPTLVIFCPEEHRALKVLLNRMKKPEAYMPNGNGIGKGEFIYIFDIEDRRLLCQQQFQ